MDNIIKTTDIKRGFPSAGDMFWALGGVSLEIPRGKLTILRGRSGSGKTTLMNILGALDMPTGGSVLLDGVDITALNERGRDEVRRRRMGFIFQSVALVSMLTAYENVEFALRVAGYPATGRQERAEECLRLVGLSSRMKHMPQELSGGEQQRVAIARAITHSPSVLFADEPTAELDATTGLQVVKIFRELIEKENVTVVMTTHDEGLMDIADCVYLLEDGVLING
ncbi:MAG: ABC transporter ATP-binding protein [Oscillospiraceae bacterium]|jgi:putative ABC transport system ATP-binding protein|nr:ABC transporter ATP-binding protein [Oscillospiraceae bacterium]